MRTLVIVCAAAFATVAPAARAATVEVVDHPQFGLPDVGIEYRAAAGEANRLDVFSSESSTAVRVEDPGATGVPRGGCQSVDAHAARCTVDSSADALFVSADVFLGDLDDVVDIHGAIPGWLNGGGGHDVLRGGPSNDTMTDGDAPGTADSDVMDGRQGND